MTRNQKLALGCGGAGCLGLIVLCIAGVALYFFMAKATTPTNRDFNHNVNRSSNSNASTNKNSESNANDNSNSENANDDNDDSTSSSSSSSSSLSEDEKHKLFHAAGVTGDTNLINRVGVKIGILKSDFSPTDENVSFATAHVSWAIRNTDFIRSLDTPEKARAYVEKHIND